MDFIAPRNPAIGTSNQVSGRHEPTNARVMNPNLRKRLLLSAGVTLVASAIIVAALDLRGRREPTAIARLAAAAGLLPDRVVDGRLTGGFAYRPIRIAARDGSVEESDHGRSWRIGAVGAAIPESDTHARGVAMLLTGDYDEAVRTLESATHSHKNDASILNDLSVAYTARGHSRSHDDDFAAALDAAEHAWRQQPTPEAAWNRAVALSALGVAVTAGRAWDDYLSTEKAGEWSREAASRRGAFTVAHVHRAPTTDAAADFEHELVGWAAAYVQGDVSSATSAIHRATSIARSLHEIGDGLAIDTMAELNRADAAGVARSLLTYRDALTAIDRRQFGSAIAPLSQVMPQLHVDLPSFALRDRYRLGVCLIYENRFKEAGSVASAVLKEAESRHYQLLEAQTRMLLGLSLLHEARPEAAIDAYEGSRRIYLNLQDQTNLAAAELRLADAHEYAGDLETAMSHRMRSFAASAASGNTSQLYLTLFEAGTTLAERGRPYAADVLLSDAQREASKQREFTAAAMSAMWRSTIAARLGDFSTSATRASEAAELSAKATDSGARALLEGSNVQYAGTSADEQNVERISETLRFFEASGNTAYVPQLLRQRAMLHWRNRELARAEDDLRRAVGASEQMLGEHAPLTMREGFATDMRANYRDLIHLLLERRAFVDALAFAERARLVGHGRFDASRVLAPVASLPQNRVAAVMEIQPDAILTWVVRRGSIRCVRARWSPRLEIRVRELAKGPLTLPALSEMYDLLASSWIADVPPGTDLVILPPPQLADIPFAALTERRSGRALIDELTVSTAENLAAAAGDPVVVSDSDPILVVGDPAYRQLPRLTASRNESLAVARLYKRAAVLLDDDATSANVLRAVGSAAVFQFSGHSAANELSPELSSLMLAAENGLDTRLYLRELAASRAPLKVAVLSACSTASGGRRTRVGTLTVARALLEAGAHAVVGTLRDVPDERAAAFSVALHQALMKHADVTSAVRSAQLAVRRTSHDDMTWAAFCVTLGSAASGGGAVQ